MMTKMEILIALEQLPNQERLEIIEVASRLVRQDKLAALARSAEIMLPLYEQSGELTEMTDLNTDDFVEYRDYV
jgi:hypothetical protein